MRFAATFLFVARIANAFQPKKPHHDFAKEPDSARADSNNISVPLKDVHEDGPSPLHCIRSWLIYDSSAAAAVDIRTVEALRTRLDTITLTLGTADVFTSIDGISVASGSFTPTKTQTAEILRTKPIFSRETITTGLLPKRRPSCSHVNYSQRSVICDAYLSSRGLRRNEYNVTAPYKWFDSLACPLPQTTCSYYSESSSRCLLGAHQAHLYYFPPGIRATGTDADKTPFGASHSYAPGVTFTYPSAYLSFDYITAAVELEHPRTVCPYCNYGSCGTTRIELQGTRSAIGTTQSGPVIAIPPDRVSSIILIGAAHNLDSSSVIRTMSGDSPARFETLPMDFADLVLPSSSAYYLNPLGAPGCVDQRDRDGTVSGVECNTIFKDLYRPEIAVPQVLAELQSEWSSCRMTADVAATPIALSEVTFYPIYPPQCSIMCPSSKMTHGPSVLPPTTCNLVPNANGRGDHCKKGNKVRQIISLKNAPSAVQPVNHPAAPSHYNKRHTRTTSIDSASEPNGTSALGMSTLSGQSVSYQKGHADRSPEGIGCPTNTSFPGAAANASATSQDSSQINSGAARAGSNWQVNLVPLMLLCTTITIL